VGPLRDDHRRIPWRLATAVPDAVDIAGAAYPDPRAAGASYRHTHQPPHPAAGHADPRGSHAHRGARSNPDLAIHAGAPGPYFRPVGDSGVGPLGHPGAIHPAHRPATDEHGDRHAGALGDVTPNFDGDGDADGHADSDRDSLGDAADPLTWIHAEPAEIARASGNQAVRRLSAG